MLVSMMKEFKDWMMQNYDYIDNMSNASFCYQDMKQAYFAKSQELTRLRVFAADVVKSPEMTAFYLFKHGIVDKNGKPI